MMKGVVKVRARAFTGYGMEWIEAVVDPDGDVRVWDDIDKCFTRCHILSERAKAKIRRLAKREKQCSPE